MQQDQNRFDAKSQQKEISFFTTVIPSLLLPTRICNKNRGWQSPLLNILRYWSKCATVAFESLPRKSSDDLYSDLPRYLFVLNVEGELLRADWLQLTKFKELELLQLDFIREDLSVCFLTVCRIGGTTYSRSHPFPVQSHQIDAFCHKSKVAGEISGMKESHTAAFNLSGESQEPIHIGSNKKRTRNMVNKVWVVFKFVHNVDFVEVPWRSGTQRASGNERNRFNLLASENKRQWFIWVRRYYRPADNAADPVWISSSGHTLDSSENNYALTGNPRMGT